MARFKAYDSRLNACVLAAGESRFKHSFGGPIGAIEAKLARAPLHVLYNLDLRDPLLGWLGLTARMLPLVFPMTVDGGEVSYAVAPAGGIKLFGKVPGPRSADWPGEDYPEFFEQRPVQLRALSYVEYRAATFKYQLGPTEWLRKDDRELIEKLGDPFTQIGGVQELPFGEPFDRSCPNPECAQHEHPSAMSVFVSIWNEPLPGITLWYDGADILLVFSICETCKAISATNMCD